MNREFCQTDREKEKELKEVGEEHGLVGDELWAYIDRKMVEWKKDKKEEEDRIKREEAREREYAEREKERERRRAEREREYAEREKERQRMRAERERQLEEREKELVMREFIEMLEEICEEKGKTEEESRKFIEYNLKGCRWGTIAEEREEKARVKEEERVARERARERVKSRKAEKEKKERTKREEEREFLREVCRLGGVGLDDSDPTEAGTYRPECGVVSAFSCSRCRGTGHDPRSCPQQSDRLRRSVGVKCYSCGVVGHYARSCPRGYELREAVTTRGEKLASEVDASNAYASDRSATDVQVSNVGPGDAVTSGTYTSDRKAAVVKVNEVNPSKEEARGVETGEQASGKEGVFPGGGTTRERGGLGGVEFPNLLVSQAGHSHAVRQLQVQDQGLRKARELVSGTRALQAAGSGDRERRVPFGRADLLQAGDSGHREMRAPTVVREPLQTGDSGSLGDQVPTVVRGPLQAVDNGHREMRPPFVVRESLQAGDTGKLEEQVPAVREVLLQPGDSDSPERLGPTVERGTDWHRLVQTKDGDDPGGQDPKVFEVPVQTGDTSDPEWGVLAVRCVPVIADGESGLSVRPAVSPAKGDGEVCVTIQTAVVKVSPTLAECAETFRSDRTVGAVQVKRHEEMQLEVQQVTSSFNNSSSELKLTYAMQKLEQSELESLQTQLAEETSDSERVRVGVKMHYQLKARVKSPTGASDWRLARRPTVGSASQRTQRGKRSRRRDRRRHASSRLGSDRTSRDVNKKGWVTSEGIGKALFTSSSHRERVQRARKEVGGALTRTPRLSRLWDRQRVAHGNAQVVSSLRYQEPLHRQKGVNGLGMDLAAEVGRSQVTWRFETAELHTNNRLVMGSLLIQKHDAHFTHSPGEVQGVETNSAETEWSLVRTEIAEGGATGDTDGKADRMSHVDRNRPIAVSARNSKTRGNQNKAVNGQGLVGWLSPNSVGRVINSRRGAARAAGQPDPITDGSVKKLFSEKDDVNLTPGRVKFSDVRSSMVPDIHGPSDGFSHVACAELAYGLTALDDAQRFIPYWAEWNLWKGNDRKIELGESRVRG